MSTVNAVNPAIDQTVQIFDRFYRADKARTSTAGRTGLGLSIAKAIVEAHGGTITAKSDLGHGSSFLIRLN